ncbi:sigma factor [Streptomyces sp. NBS 14/10]|uniref:sigma factor n=1 Tax=Streptomyces sp. NBS 14/10 TaxID=1945643 RepID=UPI000B7FA7B7|nr:sigma factor [Streptomyces sp. NBS 14/10]KAK1178665.1 sigma factor [Streptomyces sp. NBS 14/10]NUS81248.1 RNA polymerase subunit sigma-70 [Streptomyces sp.]
MPDTSPTDPVAKAFEAQRGRLRAVAYRMLGSHADAEDAVQEAWLRLSRQDTATIHNLAGWLTTVVGRISLDVLRSRQAHPAASYDDRLPELVVGKSTAATKMLASRARRKVHTAQRPTSGGREQRAVVQAFLAAARHGDFEGLLRVLDPEVRLTVETPDGVAVVLGATQVAARARLSAGTAPRGRAALVNGEPGIVSWHEDGTPLSVMAFTVVGGRIARIAVVIDPARLASMDLPGPV